MKEAEEPYEWDNGAHEKIISGTASVSDMPPKSQSQPFCVLKILSATFLRNLGKSLFIATVSFINSWSMWSSSEVELWLKKHSSCKKINVKITCIYQTRWTLFSPNGHCLHTLQLHVFSIIPHELLLALLPACIFLSSCLLHRLMITQHKSPRTGLARPGPPWRVEADKDLSSPSQNLP